jgi:hypothetical protein
MIQHDKFYDANDSPGDERKKKLWHRIQSTISEPRTGSSLQFHRPSFIWGIAASFLFLFAGVGTYSSWKFLSEQHQPRPIKLDRAYQSAIREFENVAFTESIAGRASQRTDERSLRSEQLSQLDAAIARMRNETNGKDLSPLVQSRLRSLYSLKLQILQQMIEQGDLEL